MKNFYNWNKSESEYKYNIIIKDLVNTFVTNNLQYKITNTSSNGGYSMSEFENITKSETKKKRHLLIMWAFLVVLNKFISWNWGILIVLNK